MIGEIGMIYRNYNEIRNIKSGTKLWACAYEFDNNKISMGLISKPVYGMTRGYGWNYEEVTEEDSYASFFVPFRKGSETEFVKSKAVGILSRVYADTCEECVELFNSLVDEKVKWFLERADETKRDLLEK